MAAAIADMRQFGAGFSIAEHNAGVLDRLVHLLSTHTGGGKQVHDANLVATMLETGIPRLLTFKHVGFRRFAGLIEIVVP